MSTTCISQQVYGGGYTYTCLPVVTEPSTSTSTSTSVISSTASTSPATGSVVAPPGVVPWQRQFVARDESSLATFRALWSQKGPVPFRWQSAGGQPVTLGDNLAAELMAGTGSGVVNRDRSIDPLEPRPANVLDLAGGSDILLGSTNNNPAQAEVAGSETVDGRP